MIPPNLGGMEESTPTLEEEKYKHLERMLLMASPNEYRKSIQESLFSYLNNQDERAFSPNFKEVVENHFFIIDFFDKLVECG